MSDLIQRLREWADPEYEERPLCELLTEAADELEQARKELARMARAFDMIYQHSDYARDAVVTYYGTCHKPFVVEYQRAESAMFPIHEYRPADGRCQICGENQGHNIHQHTDFDSETLPTKGSDLEPVPCAFCGDPETAKLPYEKRISHANHCKGRESDKGGGDDDRGWENETPDESYHDYE